MFIAECPACGHRELRGHAALRPVRTPVGDRLAFDCRRCGGETVLGPARTAA